MLRNALSTLWTRWPSAVLLAAALGMLSSAHAADEPRPKRLLLLGQGPDDHPPTTHEYLAGLRVLEKCLAKTPGLEVSLERADEPWLEGPEKLKDVDGVVLYLSEGAKWVQAQTRRLDAFARLAERGGGFVGLHWGIGTREAEPIDAYLKLLGGCHGGPDRRYAVVEETLAPAEPRHPIATAIAPLRVRDEFYYQLKFVRPAEQIQPVMTVAIDGRKETVAWAWQRPDGGRSFGFSGLHFHDNWRLAEYRRLVVQGVLWSLDLRIPSDGADVDVPEGVFDLKARPTGGEPPERP